MNIYGKFAALKHWIPNKFIKEMQVCHKYIVCVLETLNA